MASETARALYRAFVRVGRAFNDYNVREYVRRRARAGFEENRLLRGEEATLELRKGWTELEVARRQATVYALFGATRKPSAMDV